MSGVSKGPEPVLIGTDKVPPMAIGTWSWGDTMIWKHQDDDYAKIKESWDVCNKQGLTFYDTAEVYGEGESERIIGRLIKETDEETKKKLFIATKFLPFPRPASLFLFTPPLMRNLKRSLDRLGLDKVDMYQLHSPTGHNSFESYASGLAECYKAGLCRHIGVSNFSVDEMVKFVDLLGKHGVPLASNQVEFSLLRKLPETSGLLAECKKRNIALLAYSPLGMGRLTGKYSSSNPPPKGRRFASQYTWDQLDPLINLLRDIAAKYNVTPSTIAINWVMCKGAIPLGGARDGKQAEQNASAMTFRLTEEEMTKLDGAGFEGSTSRFWQHG